MVYRIKELLYVHIHYIVHCLCHYGLIYYFQRIMTASFRTKSMRPLYKVLLIDCLQELLYSHLYYLVFYCGYPKRSYALLVLRYVYPSDWLRSVFLPP